MATTTLLETAGKISEIRKSTTGEWKIFIDGKEASKLDLDKKPLAAEAEKTGDWLPLYTWMNSEEYVSQTLDKEWRMFINKDLDVDPALARVALWEVRNLNMASNIMRVVAKNIGGNIVIIVGASHKAFLEQYLGSMLGVSIVQFKDYLTKD